MCPTQIRDYRMNSKSINGDRILRQIVPTVFFIALFVLYAYDVGLFNVVNLIAGGILLLLLCNIFLQNIVISRICGGIFLLGSCYMMLALLDDVIDGEATLGYLVVALLLIISFSMSFLLIWGYEKRKQLTRG